jgi:hypothetical protein
MSNPSLDRFAVEAQAGAPFSIVLVISPSFVFDGGASGTTVLLVF